MKRARSGAGVRRIVIIDDDLDMQAIYRHMLREEGGRYALRFAGDAARAMRIIESAPADLVVSDVIMGEMDGESFVSRLRKRGINAPVLIVSVLSEEMLPRLRRTRRVHFLQKPITGDVLRKTLKRILGE